VPRHADDVKGQAASGSNREGESTEAGRRGGAARSSVEGPVMGLERRGCVVRPWPLANWKREEPVDEAKPFKATAEHREPCDSRESCTVLGAPGGEIPSGDSTNLAARSRSREWPESARLAHSPEPRRRSLDRTDTGRSALVAGTGLHVESPRGFSPLGAPRSVREPLDSYGSRCSAGSMTELPVGEECWIYPA